MPGRSRTGARVEKVWRDTIVTHLENNKGFRLNLYFEKTDLQTLLAFMDEHQLSEPHTAIKTALAMAMTPGSRFSAAQKLKTRFIAAEVRDWLYRRMFVAISEIVDELKLAGQNAAEELEQLHHEGENATLHQNQNDEL
jgi:hypothetical protein